MTAILLNLAGYAWGMLHDLAALKATPRVKPYLLALSGISHLAAFVQIARGPKTLHPPFLLRALCVLIAPLGWAAMFYSIMVEIPFRKGWVDEGHTDELVTTGTYSLARHPGVIWFSFAIIATAIATRSKRMLLAAPVMIAGDVAHVTFQEQAVLTNVFGDAYREYQHTTPFLVPTLASFTKFVETLPNLERLIEGRREAS
jgi:protein-S-isoprenylcysteine O-methyltransferase Ste14